MQLTIEPIQLAELAGAVQGCLLAAVLVAHGTNRTANRLLAALMLAFSVSLLSEVYYATGAVRAFPHFFGVSYPLPWTFGPLVYLYAVAASDRRWRFGIRAALHFAPLLTVLLLTYPLYLQSGAEKLALLERITTGDPPAVLRLLDPTKYLSGLLYSAATVVSLRRHRRRVEESYANVERVNLRWLQTLAGVAAAIWLLATVTGVAGLLPAALERSGAHAVSLAVALLVYAIGYKGLRQPEIFRYDRLDDDRRDDDRRDDDRRDGDREEAAPVVAGSAPAPGEETQPAAGVPPRGDSRYERSGLGEFETRRLKAALLALMTEQCPYRDAELTLPMLAAALGTTPHKLSEVLNRELAQSFFDFVNGYRVDDVRRRLADPGTRHLNILALGLDAGFASKSTFNSAFKKLTGQTPSAYRKTLDAERARAG